MINSRLTGKRIFISGGAGFIGSNLAGLLLGMGCRVTAFDNLSLGKVSFIENYLDNPAFNFVEEDLLNKKVLRKAMAGHDIVFHLAANSDISDSSQSTDIDLKLGVIATYNVLENMRLNKIEEIVFSSTSTIYGEPDLKPTPEDYGPLLPISFYGASKLACEGYITAFAHNFGIRAWIYRLANIVGPNGTHGVIYDFIHKLKKSPRCLKILGDGKQSKPYLYIDDCLEGMLFAYEHGRNEVNYFNLTCRDTTNVTTIAKFVIREMGLKNVRFDYTGQSRGWSGDVPQVELDPAKINKLGWKPTYSSDEAVRLAVKDLVEELES